jgi:hypothetical protein
MKLEGGNAVAFNQTVQRFILMYIRRKFYERRKGKGMYATLIYQKQKERNNIFIDYQYDEITSSFSLMTK